MAEFEAVHSLREARIILDQAGGRNLAAGDHLLEDDGFSPGAAGVERGREARAAAANDRDFVVAHEVQVPFAGSVGRGAATGASPALAMERSSR